MSDPVPESRGERELIRRMQSALAAVRPPATDPAARPLVPFGDDMAALDPSAADLLWTVDMLMDGVDFDSHVHAWPAIGRKAMAASLSDCAAMAVAPLGALCAVSLCNALSMDDALSLIKGAHEYGVRFGCPIVGGDTNSWDAPTVISISVAARVPPGRQPVRRDGARPGDRIWLTGPVGGSILGRHMTFEPRIAAALEISRQLGPHAMIDISDGLALDLGRILEASGCGAILDAAALDAAIHPDAVQLAARDARSPREHALHDGEDFELIVVLPAAADSEATRQSGLLPLGRCTAQPGLWLTSAAGAQEAIAIRGWEHFR